jgi:hypothetical protein
MLGAACPPANGLLGADGATDGRTPVRVLPWSPRSSVQALGRRHAVSAPVIDARRSLPPPGRPHEDKRECSIRHQELG